MNDEKYRLKVNKKFPETNLLLEYFCILFGPFYSVYLLIINSKKITDPEALKLNELKEKDSKYTKFYMAKKRFNFQQIRNCYKRFKEKTTFNEYLMGVLSVSMDKWYKTNGIEGAEKLKVVNSINLRPLPKSIKEVDMFNQSIGMFLKLLLLN